MNGYSYNAVGPVLGAVALLVGGATGEYCPGNYDHSYNYRGFSCPREYDAADRIYCCGSEDYKYCCNFKYTGLPAGAIIGIICGVCFIVAMVTLALCCVCSGCPMHHRRNPGIVHSGGQGRTPLVSADMVSTVAGSTTIIQAYPQNHVLQPAAVPQPPPYSTVCPPPPYVQVSTTRDQNVGIQDQGQANIMPR